MRSKFRNAIQAFVVGYGVNFTFVVYLPVLEGNAVLVDIFQPKKKVSYEVGNKIQSSWNAMAYGDPREGKWKGNWRMEWVASTLHTTPEHGVSSITTAPHTSAASSRLNWRPGRFKWTRPFRRKKKSGFCACAITFQTQSTKVQLPVENIANISSGFWCKKFLHKT